MTVYNPAADIRAAEENYLRHKDEVTKFDTGAVRGSEQLRFDLISPYILIALADAYTEGSKKYGDDNYLNGISSKNLMAHALSHIVQWQRGDDSEDHLGHALWNIGTIIHFQKTGRHDLIVRQYAPGYQTEYKRKEAERNDKDCKEAADNFLINTGTIPDPVDPALVADIHQFMRQTEIAPSDKLVRVLSTLHPVRMKVIDAVSKIWGTVRVMDQKSFADLLTQLRG